MKAAVLILGILVCSAATAEPRQWMKKENPGTLHSFVSVDPRCPFSTAEVREIVNGIVFRSGLRPGNYAESSETFGFRVTLDCLPSGDRAFVFMFDVKFIRQAFGRTLHEAVPIYGSIGLGDKASIRPLIQRDVEQLVTDYLQAHFDLTPE